MCYYLCEKEHNMENKLKELVKVQKEGEKIGIYSACSANPFVIEAVLLRGKKDNACVLIESTANQCDQFGGYTGKKPKDFKNDVYDIAKKIGFDTEKLFLGGDHLGPLTFAKYDEDKAMSLAKDLIKEYVSAGFTKIHIDTSMKVASDPQNERLSDETIAKRGAMLAKVAEETYQELLKTNKDAPHPVYVVGSEVPIPGGSTDNNNNLQVTKPEDMKKTVESFKKIFYEAGLQQAWENVIAIVVQPGIEEKDDGCVEYDRDKARDLMASIKEYDNLIFEGHSTDYQTKYKLRELVEDGVGILKVGPALTYGLREGLYSLSFIEDELIDADKRSNVRDELDKAMLSNPVHWQKHYHGTDEEIALKRKYSFSDRSRYYYANDNVSKAIDVLFDNLKCGVSLSLLSQFMPVQYTKVREKTINNDPKSLVLDKIDNVISDYIYATQQEKL